MNEIKLLVQDAVDELLMSQSTIYSWIEKGFLKTQDSPAGRVIVISENELKQIRERNLKSKRNKVSKQIKHNEAISGIVDAEIVGTSQEGIAKNISAQENIELIKMISDLATKAGKYELLEDIQKQKEKDVEYWRSEFFRLQSEQILLQNQNADLIKSVAQKDKKIVELDEEIKKLKRPFSFLFK